MGAPVCGRKCTGWTGASEPQPPAGPPQPGAAALDARLGAPRPSWQDGQAVHTQGLLPRHITPQVYRHLPESLAGLAAPLGHGEHPGHRTPGSPVAVPPARTCPHDSPTGAHRSPSSLPSGTSEVSATLGVPLVYPRLASEPYVVLSPGRGVCQARAPCPGPASASWTAPGHRRRTDLTLSA